MFFCPKCGEAIPDNSEACPICGEQLKKNDAEPAIVYASPASTNASDSDKKSAAQILSTIPKTAKIVIAAIAAVVIIALIVNVVGKSSLKKSLMGEWGMMDDDLLKVLEFSDKDIEYRFESNYAFLNTTVDRIEYKVVSKNKIKINRVSDIWETIVIDFSPTKEILTLSPAITCSDNEEKWIRIDN